MTMQTPLTAELAAWMLSKPFGFLTDKDLPHLVTHHRLCLVLVRLGGAGGRFMAPAQNIATLIQYCEKAGDYIRDVSICSEELEKARQVPAAPLDGNYVKKPAPLKWAGKVREPGVSFHPL